MPNLDLGRLKALAEKATPGTWLVRDGEIQRQDERGKPWDHVVCFGHDYDDYGSASDDDKAYIAACSPDVILSLIARLEKIEQWAIRGMATEQAAIDSPRHGYHIAQAEVLRLLREQV